MGTRNLIEVTYKGQLRVAQYGQWDGYPTGQGANIADFIHNKMDEDKFKTALENVSWIDDDVFEKEIRKVRPDWPANGWLNLEQSKWFDDTYPELSRNTGAGILEIVQNTNGQIKLRDSSDFKSDGLFCEYYYHIDVDNRTVSVNKGEPIPFAEWTLEKMKQLKEEQQAEQW